MDDDNNQHNIFSLSDYSLIHIFKYVSSTDLYNLSLTCKRFEDLVKEKKLWYKIDARDGLNNKEKVRYCIERINDRTTDLLICSDHRDIQVLPDDFFTWSACINLTVLALENQLLRGDLAKLSEYPKTLVELSLRKSFVLSYSTFFKLSYWQMENLKVLILDECGWVETYMLVQMSKYPKLEVLSLFKCKKLSDNDIAYLSLAGCFGFKQIRILDVRFTGLGDQILKSFYKHPTLQELYFQNYISTYKLDKTRRLLEIARGSPQKPHAYLSEFDDVPDTNIEAMQELFGKHAYRTCRRENMSNHSVIMYKFVVPNLDDDYEVESVLYKSPYGECNCGYGNRHVQSFPTTEKTKSAHKSNREEIIRLKDIIKEEKYKQCSPFLYVLAPKLHMDPYISNTDDVFFEIQASTSNKQIYWINMREPLNVYEMSMFEHTDIHSLQSDVLSLDVMRCFGCDPTVILGEPGPKIQRANARDFPENLSDNSENEDVEGNYDMGSVSNNLVSLKDGSMIIEEICQSLQDSDEENEQSETKEENTIAKSEDSEEIREDNQKLENEHASNGFHDFSDYTAKESDADNDSDLNKEESFSKNNIDDDDDDKFAIPYERKICRHCGIKVTETKDYEDVCWECKERTKVKESKIIRFKFMRNKPEDISTEPSNSNNEPEKISELESNLPSTSKMEANASPASTSNKRRCDFTSTSTETKKLKPSFTNDEANDGGMLQLDDQDDLNISYEVDDVNVRLQRPNMVYINMNFADEEEDDEPNLINVPMGRGLINILLGVDNKTKTGIKKLSLRGFPKITDCALDYLTTLKLDLLDVTKTGVTRCGVRTFIRQNPTCRVLHESACVCQPDMHF